MSKIEIGNITANNVVVGDKNTITYNHGTGSLELNQQEREIIDELLKLMKSDQEQGLFLEDVKSYKETKNEVERKTVGTRLLSTVSKVVNIASATDTGFSLYERFTQMFELL